MTRACSVLALATLVGGCSVLFEDARYANGADAGANDGGTTDGGRIDGAVDGGGDAGLERCPDEGCGAGRRCRASDDVCVPCDADGDGFASADTACDASAGSAARDCDDDDATVFPDAPAICGDGQLNACPGTGLALRSEIAALLGAQEAGRLAPRTLLAASGGQHLDSPAISAVRLADGRTRVLASFAVLQSAGVPTVQQHLLDGDLGTVDTQDLATDVAPGFFLVASRARDDGRISLGAMRYGDMLGEVHLGTVDPSMDDLATATNLTLRDASTSCIDSGSSGFAAVNYPFGFAQMTAEGDFAGINRYGSQPWFVIPQTGAPRCNSLAGGLDGYSTAGMASGRRGLVVFWDDAESNNALTTWLPSRTDRFAAGTGLSSNDPGSIDALGADSGVERSLLLARAAGAPRQLRVLAIDCTVASESCFPSGATPRSYVASTAGTTEALSPILRRLTASTAAMIFVENRTSGATPPATRVQELVMHIVGRDLGVGYAGASGELGEGVPVLRYEINEGATDYRQLLRIDAALVRDNTTGDLTVYALGVYAQNVPDSFVRPQSADAVVGGVRICAAR